MGDDYEWGNFQWNKQKEADVLKKHGFPFKKAASMFNGKGLLKTAKTVDGQVRHMMIGEPRPPVEKPAGGDNIWKAIYTIVRTQNGPRIRLISVHDANAAERAEYLAMVKDQMKDQGEME